jgi:X breakpoint 2-interacting protein
VFEILINPTRLIIVSFSVQGDMRDFLNMPGSLPRAGNGTANGIFDLEPPQTPLGGRMDVFDLPFHMARDQIEQSLRAKMASIKVKLLL